MAGFGVGLGLCGPRAHPKPHAFCQSVGATGFRLLLGVQSTRGCILAGDAGAGQRRTRCACLLQQKVRYDGEQRRSESVADLSATRVDCTPVAGAEAARAVEAYATGDTPLHEAMTVLRRLARDLA